MKVTRLDRIDSQIAGLEAQKLRLLAQPEDVYENGDVVWFKKTFSRASFAYTYAAVRVNSHWYLTQNGARYRDGEEPKSWEDLLEFIGDGEMWVATEWERLQ